MTLQVRFFSPSEAVFCCFHPFFFSRMKHFPDTILSSDFIPAYIREGFVKIRGRRKTRIFTNLFK